MTSVISSQCVHRIRSNAHSMWNKHCNLLFVLLWCSCLGEEKSIRSV